MHHSHSVNDGRHWCWCPRNWSALKLSQNLVRAPPAAVLKSSDGSRTMIAHAQSQEQKLRADAMAKQLPLHGAGLEAKIPTAAAAAATVDSAVSRKDNGQSVPSRGEAKAKELELAQARRRAAMFVTHTETYFDKAMQSLEDSRLPRRRNMGTASLASRSVECLQSSRQNGGTRRSLAIVSLVAGRGSAAVAARTQLDDHRIVSSAERPPGGHADEVKEPADDGEFESAIEMMMVAARDALRRDVRSAPPVQPALHGQRRLTSWRDQMRGRPAFSPEKEEDLGSPPRLRHRPATAPPPPLSPSSSRRETTQRGTQQRPLPLARRGGSVAVSRDLLASLYERHGSAVGTRHQPRSAETWEEATREDERGNGGGALVMMWHIRIASLNH